MGEISLEGVRKAFGRHPVINGIDLTVGAGELCVFLGPSGCGKSTLLRLIAGLEQVSAGTIRIGGRDVTRLPPKQRGLAMVFQSYALYPHMTAYDNLAFGLRLGRRKRDEIERRVRATARMLRIEELLQRRPAQLSGGQRQRVAIGRALVREPGVLLLDEPLSNLDADLRARMRVELAQLHRRLGATMVYVTHDQVEAMTLADRLVLLQEGRIAQCGAPLELYQRPRSLFVARFLGGTRMNLLPARLIGTGRRETLVEVAGGVRIKAEVDSSRAGEGEPVTLGVRPEDLRPGEARNALSGRVGLVERLGDHALVYCNLDGVEEPLVLRCAGAPLPVPGELLRPGFPAAAGHLFDRCGNAFPRTDKSPGRNAESKTLSPLQKDSHQRIEED
jgi:multiple sugar transport system ATP-binding protein